MSDMAANELVDLVGETVRNWLAENWTEIKGGSSPGLDDLSRRLLSLCRKYQSHHP